MSAFKYCHETLEHSQKLIRKVTETFISKRNIIYVDSKDIKRGELQVKTLKGTRSVHCTQSVGVEFELKVKNLSCVCPSCVQEVAPCHNSQYVDQWYLKRIGSAAAEVSRLSHEDDSDCILNLYFSQVFQKSFQNFDA